MRAVRSGHHPDRLRSRGLASPVLRTALRDDRTPLIYKLCTIAGCDEVTTGGLRCKAHQNQADAKRGSSKDRGWDPEWRAVRKLVLARDDYTCQIRGRRCTRIATTVDHIIPRSKGGARADPANLRAACSWCNTSKGASLA